MSCMSQNFRLFHISNLSVRNFRIFCSCRYTGSTAPAHVSRASASSNGVRFLCASHRSALIKHFPANLSWSVSAECGGCWTVTNNTKGGSSGPVWGAFWTRVPNLPPFSTFSTDLDHLTLTFLNVDIQFLFYVYSYIYLIVLWGAKHPFRTFGGHVSVASSIRP